MIMLIVHLLFPMSGFCSAMSRRRQKACSQVNLPQRQRWPQERRRWLKCAAWSNTSFVMQTNVSAQSWWDPVTVYSAHCTSQIRFCQVTVCGVCSLCKWAYSMYRSLIVCLSFSAGGPRLKCSELLRHVMEVLSNSYSCSVCGEDYSSLLVKDILSVRKYWCDISLQQWQSQWAVCLNQFICLGILI